MRIPVIIALIVQYIVFSVLIAEWDCYNPILFYFKSFQNSTQAICF